MIRAEALARGRLFTRFLIVLAVVLATFALVADALAAGTPGMIPVQATADAGGLYLPLEPFQQPMPEPIDGWEVAIRVDNLFAVGESAGWPFARLTDAGDAGPSMTREADLALGGLCFLAAGLLLWIARQRRPLA